MATTYTFSRSYLLSDSAGNSGSSQVSPQAPSGGTQGTFVLSDPSASGADNPNVLGDTANDQFQIDQTVNDVSRTFTNRQYVGELPDGSGAVAKVVSATTGLTTYFLYTDNNYDTGTPITYTTDPFPLCFVAGTRILTARGEVAVEDLHEGDLAMTASGARRPVVWIGQRRLASERGALPGEQQPVRVRAGAFGQDADGTPVPARDLCLSPGHPVLVGADADGAGGVLVPVMCLINGTAIARETVAAVTYWHVELDAHDILLAEGLPAESYFDMGSRAFFTESSDARLHDPDLVPPGLSGRCRPVATHGPLVEAQRARIDYAFSAILCAHCAWNDAGAIELAVS